MADSRFTTAFDDVEELLDVVDLDEIDELETLLMSLLDRPVGVSEGWDDEKGVDALDVRIHGADLTFGQLHGFPLSLLDLARSCAELAQEVGPYAADDEPTTDLLSLTDDELIHALQLALGRVRLFSMLDGD